MIGETRDQPRLSDEAGAPPASEVDPEPEVALWPADFLLEGKYRLQGEIGRGGMGAVYRAYDESLERTVAIKLVLPSPERSRAKLERFQREAKAMASVSHPNVLQIYSYGTVGETGFLVLEYVEGQSAEELVEAAKRRRTRLPLGKALAIVDRVAAGLEAAHRADVVHRDVKPANVLVEAGTGRVVITDFGIGKRYLPGDVRRTVEPAGSPAYMAPEVLLGRPISREADQLTDIYSLGVTAFELLTGELPYDAENWAELALRRPDPLPKVSDLRPGLPREVDEAVARCLARDPADRFQSCGELREALAAAIAASLARGPVSAAPARREPGPMGRARVAGTRRSVVVAHPDAALRTLAYYCVEDLCSGVEMEATRSNRKALELVRRGPPLLLLAGLDDPDLNGVELAATLRQEPGLEDVRLVLVADAVTQGERRLLERLGVSKILLNPVVRAELLALVRHYCGVP